MAVEQISNRRKQPNADRQTVPLTFTASHGLYVMAPDVTGVEVQDHLDARQAQLTALLTMTTGTGAEAFGGWNEELRDAYMGVCASLSRECQDLTKAASLLLSEAA